MPRSSKPDSQPRPIRIRVTSQAERRVRSGHPWVFADSVREQDRPGQPGELAVLYDRQNRFLALGMLDPESPIRVRILQTGKPAQIDAGWWRERLREAVLRRAGLFDGQTTGYRWIHGESDGWPGLVLDRYGTTLVLKLYTRAWLPRLQELSDLIQLELKPERLILRLSRKLSAPGGDGCPHDGSALIGAAGDGKARFQETGLWFEADVVSGQKTGFFLDQRENRRWVETLARNRTVLNAFSYSGGFSLYAARGRATAVTDLDLSAHALAAARTNFELNATVPAVAGCPREPVQAEAFDWLASSTRRRFGLVILDPPSFAKKEVERTGAIRAYERLAGLGIGRLEEGGMLLACSCSAHVSREEFFEAVRRAAAKSGRKFSVWKTSGHPPDHPATFPEAEYLKAILLNVD